MSAEWYYAKNKQQHGPVSSAGLKELAQSGELLPSDKIWKEGLPEWVPASHVEGLMFAETEVTPTPPRKKTTPRPPSEPDDDPAADEDDDRPKRKKKRRVPSSSGGGSKVLVWVLCGVAAILLLFCGGGGIIGLAYSGILGGAWTAVQPVNPSRVFEVKTGMSQKECEALMGPGKVVSRELIPRIGGRPPHEIKSVVWEDGRGSRAQLSFMDDKVQIGFR